MKDTREDCLNHRLPLSTARKYNNLGLIDLVLNLQVHGGYRGLVQCEDLGLPQVRGESASGQSSSLQGPGEQNREYFLWVNYATNQSHYLLISTFTPCIQHQR